MPLDARWQEYLDDLEAHPERGPDDDDVPSAAELADALGALERNRRVWLMTHLIEMLSPTLIAKLIETAADRQPMAWYDEIETLALSVEGQPMLTLADVDELDARLRDHRPVAVPVPPSIEGYGKSIFALLEHYRAGTASAFEIVCAYHFYQEAAAWFDRATGEEPSTSRQTTRVMLADVLGRMAREVVKLGAVASSFAD